MGDGILKSTVVKKGEATVCQLQGEISYETVLQLRHEFAQIRESGAQIIVLDLINLRELGSAGLGEMARLILWCESKNGKIKMVCDTDHIREMLGISGLEKYAPIYTSLDEALISD